jgi:hypothetical protein
MRTLLAVTLKKDHFSNQSSSKPSRLSHIHAHLFVGASWSPRVTTTRILYIVFCYVYKFDDIQSLGVPENTW